MEELVEELGESGYDPGSDEDAQASEYGNSASL